MAGIVGIKLTVTIHDAVLPAIDHALSPSAWPQMPIDAGLRWVLAPYRLPF